MSFHELMLMNTLFKLLENTNIYISILIGLVSLMYYDKKFINLNYCSNFFKKKITKISFVAEDKTASSRFRALMFYISKNCKVDELLESVKKSTEKYKNTGLQVEATGPWPSFSFVNIKEK